MNSKEVKLELEKVLKMYDALKNAAVIINKLEVAEKELSSLETKSNAIKKEIEANNQKLTDGRQLLLKERANADAELLNHQEKIKAAMKQAELNREELIANANNQRDNILKAVKEEATKVRNSILFDIDKLKEVEKTLLESNAVLKNEKKSLEEKVVFEKQELEKLQAVKQTLANLLKNVS